MAYSYYQDTYESRSFECAWCEDEIEAGEEHWIEEDPDNGKKYHYHNDCYDEYDAGDEDDDDDDEDDDDDDEDDDDDDDDYEGSDNDSI
ncbi:hypothetical protein Neosp_014222 [[Neocosmospora] mangrovei]